MLQYICNPGFVSGGCSLGQVFPSSWSLIQQTEIRAYLDLQRKTLFKANSWDRSERDRYTVMIDNEPRE